MSANVPAFNFTRPIKRQEKERRKKPRSKRRKYLGAYTNELDRSLENLAKRKK